MSQLNRVLVVGGSGFVGTRLVDRLVTSGQFSVKILDKIKGNFFREITTVGDVRSLNDLRPAFKNHDVVISLAAEHKDNIKPISLYNDVNVEGARNICTAASEAGARIIIFTSTVAVYGFAPIGTDESGKIAPFNDYGRTKYEAENIYRDWQSADPLRRVLVILRPTVIFGERNRGNVYNLFRVIALKRFLMVGSGKNRKSVAYVENVAAFLEYSIKFQPGVHTYNYVDKPDFTMNQLVGLVRAVLGLSDNPSFRLPFVFGYLVGRVFDFAAFLTGREFGISSIRIRKFCANSTYGTSIDKTGFIPPVILEQALIKTIKYEFVEDHLNEPIFFSE